MAKYMLGNARHQLDDKGRVRIPAKFKEGLGAVSYILPGRDGCLFVFPENEFDTLIDSLSPANIYANDEKNELATMLMAAGSSLDEDAQGRVRIAPELLKVADIRKDIVFVGKGKFLEVWAAEKWDSNYSVLNPANLNRIIERLKHFGV